MLAEIGIYSDAVSAQFGGLRQASVVNALAACALLVALTAMALRFPAYVRGRQMDAQLLLARRVQEDLLPASMPALRQAEVHAVCVPAFEVGGDLFDFVSLDEDRFVFLLGDYPAKVFRRLCSWPWCTARFTVESCGLPAGIWDGGCVDSTHC